ncbi:2-amino-4-hydroxy-6-hydroxymethyldihydropteridine diphosphokinase [Amphibacillus indicireducens]|uniref:2-amino-4-hydroxy-6-hydroxymethyldihydropteridine diphosphokinase n=2 Tax=Amphibacillus indicireducens TaxID=1076330 RepID=A0ABP7VX52_9BACI
MNKVYIALGSNIAPRVDYLNQAIEAIGQVEQMSVVKQSSIYETEPVGYQDQAKFLNQVIEVETTYSPMEVLLASQSIENKLGRKREVRWGPRTIDLDILLYNHENIMTNQLIVPHPRMDSRAFVLVPLVELNPELVIPTTNQTVSEQLSLIANHEKRGVVKWIKKDGVDESGLIEN